VETKANVVRFGESKFLDPECIDELINVASATSAFPIAFPPVKGVTEDDQRYYIDGGLWDNQPIDLAVESLKDKPASRRTCRIVFFIEPNPSVLQPDSEKR